MNMNYFISTDCNVYYNLTENEARRLQIKLGGTICSDLHLVESIKNEFKQINKEREMTREENIRNLKEFIKKGLGYEGRMISYSKSNYIKANKFNVVAFNANMCIAGEKIWHGDLDITKDVIALSNIAKIAGETIYILNEMDARFENEEDFNINSAIAIFHADGYYNLNKRLESAYPSFINNPAPTWSPEL